jgi:hypothetical protein
MAVYQFRGLDAAAVGSNPAHTTLSYDLLAFIERHRPTRMAPACWSETDSLHGKTKPITTRLRWET